MRYIDFADILKLESGKRYYGTVVPIDPRISEFAPTHTARLGDRWDTLAYRYLGDARLWYILANANSAANGSIFVKPGTIVVIPEV